MKEDQRETLNSTTIPNKPHISTSDVKIPEDWLKSHLKHKGYKRVLHDCASFNNSLMLLLAHRVNIFDILEEFGGVFATVTQIKEKICQKCEEKMLAELLEYLVENKYIIKDIQEVKVEYYDDKRVELQVKYKNSNMGRKLCRKNVNSQDLKNYSNLLYLMERTLNKFQIADANLIEGRHYGITSHLFYNEQDLKNTLYSIEKLYSISYDNFLTYVDFSKTKMSIMILGGGCGKFAEKVKFLNPANEVNIIDDKAVFPIVTDYLKLRKMDSKIFFYTFHLDKEELFPNGDMYIISYYLHWNTYEKNKRLFRIIFNSLKPEGKLVLIEFIKETKSQEKFSILFDKDEHSVAMYNTYNLLLNDFDGHSPTLEELLYLAKEIGFKSSDVITTKGLASIITFSK